MKLFFPYVFLDYSRRRGRSWCSGVSVNWVPSGHADMKMGWFGPSDADENHCLGLCWRYHGPYVTGGEQKRAKGDPLSIPFFVCNFDRGQAVLSRWQANVNP